MVVAAVLVVWGIANLVALRSGAVLPDKRLVRFYRIGYALMVGRQRAPRFLLEGRFWVTFIGQSY